MSSFIEGVGDEVLYMSGVIIILTMVALAWTSTCVAPLWNQPAVWLVQLQTWPTTRVLQVVHVNEAERENTGGVNNDANTRTVRMQVTDSQRSHSPNTDARQAATTILNAALETSENGAESSGEPGACTCTVIPSTIQSNDVPSTPPSEMTSSMHETPALLGDTRIRLKFLDDTQRLVGAWLQQTVVDFKRLHFSADVDSGKAIRLIFQGQLLRDDTRSLGSYGLYDNCIVHCHVSNTPYAQPNIANIANNHAINVINADTPALEVQGEIRRLQPGGFIFCIFAFKFMAIWFLYFSYPQYFDFASFFSLVLCTMIYFTFLFGNRIRARREGINNANLNTNLPNINAN